MSEQAAQTDVKRALARVERVKGVLGQVHSYAQRERLTALWEATHQGLGDLESLSRFLESRDRREPEVD